MAQILQGLTYELFSTPFPKFVAIESSLLIPGKSAIFNQSLVAMMSQHQILVYIMTGTIKAHSHDPILRIRFWVTKIGSRCSDGPISRFRFCGENIGSVFTRSDFQN